MSYTGRRVNQFTSYDVNTDTGGNETWEIEEAFTVSPKELEILRYSLLCFQDITQQCIQDYLGIRGHREEIVEMVEQLESVQSLIDKLEA